MAFSNETKQPTKKSKETDAELVSPVSEAECWKKLAKQEDARNDSDSIDTARRNRKRVETEVRTHHKSQQGSTLYCDSCALVLPRRVYWTQQRNDNRQKRRRRTPVTGETEENAQQDEVSTLRLNQRTMPGFDLLLERRGEINRVRLAHL